MAASRWEDSAPEPLPCWPQSALSRSAAQATHSIDSAYAACQPSHATPLTLLLTRLLPPLSYVQLTRLPDLVSSRSSIMGASWRTLRV